MGDEPMNNTLYGFDAQYQDESRLITELVDAIPGISTKEISSVDASIEFAHLLPGHNKAIGDNGASYIDDFEGSVSLIDLRNFASWGLASIPQGQPDLFPEASPTDDVSLGYNRANTAWYILDPLFFRDNNLTPDNVNNDRHYQREVTEREVFPNRELPAGTPANIATLDLAYYPSERGPYNYETSGSAHSAGIEPETGELADPQSRWGGIMRAINTTDFEQTNVEFIQFWVMDPYNADNRQFLGTEGNPTAKLLVNLGNVSEDVLKDGQMSFENGLPLDPDNPEGLLTNETNWARVPTTQSIVNAFDNTTNSNEAQDVGFDGYNDAGEREKYADFLEDLAAIPGVAPAVVDAANGDPSSDNYRFYRGSDYDNEGADIIDRYKQFNGFEGNSITTQDSQEEGNNFPTQATTLPTTEDVNQDLTLTEAESYYQYSIDLPDPQVSPGAWQVGNNYITDVTEGVDPDGRTVNWYQFKIPVREGRSINNIQDLRSVRFMRMVTTGFDSPVVLRFARLELVRGEWRRYNESLREGEFIPGAPGQTEFDILAVNVEENSQRTPLNYVTPPGISREIDAGTANLRSLNEQSLVLRVRNLGDGDARAAFRSINIDMRMYGAMEMFIHGETLDMMRELAFADLTVFIRLGTDFDQNFYEYEIPLTPTGLNSSSTPQNIWPEENNMVIEFDKLQSAKNSRNQSGVPDNEIYVESDGDRRIRIRGNPVLSAVRTVMIGVRNPNASGSPLSGNIWTEDDGLPQSGEIWVNELRLTDFNNEGGWAAVGRVNTQLADFGNVSVAANISTPNFGSLGSRVAERPQERRMGYDASANLNMGEFLPEESGIKIPVYMSQAEEVVLPKFDPLAPDLELEEVTRGLTREERREVRKRSQTYTRRRSLNLTNIRKERTDNTKKAQFYDIENLNATVSYNSQEFYDINTAFDNRYQYRFGLGYNFSAKPKSYKPFARSKFLRSTDYLALIRDFNFALVPKNISFRSDINRTYNEQQYKNNSDVFSFDQPVLYNKTFNWNRVYDVQHDLTQSIRLTYSANNLSYVLEPTGRADGSTQYRDSVWSSLLSFGENINFSQNVTANYKLPISKIPILDWISADVRYSGAYNWQRAAFSQDSLGNTIQNSRAISINGQFNFLSLYNKVGFFKDVNDKFQRQSRAGGRSLTRGRGRGGKEQEEEEEKEDKDDENKIGPLDYFAKLLMSLKNITVVYTQNEGTFLPGYNQESNIIGMNPGFSAPGIDFVLGHQIADFNREAALRGWLVENEFINQQYMETYTEDFNLRVNFEPLPNLRVEFNSIRSKSLNDGSFYRFNNDLQQYLEDSRFESGSFSISLLTLNTIGDDPLDVWNDFLENRPAVSNRLAVETGFSTPNSSVLDEDYAEGFGSTSQQVAIPAFVAAFSGQDPENVNLTIEDYSLLDAIRNPSWTVNYDGLSKIPAIKKIFRNITLSHSYRSVFSVNNFTTNFAAGTGVDGEPLRDNSEEQNIIPERQIAAISISEQLSPLIKIDVTWQNSLITNFEINRNRTLTFSTSNFQLTENRSDEIVLGLGYRFPDVEIKLGGKKRKSDLNVRADLSIRDTEMVARRMVEGTNQITSGQNLISLKTAIDYVISDRLNIRAFYDHQINEPKVSISFPTSNINAGISLRFTLTQ
ncbi:MAG: cell surface protein SprA [Flavobacteriales bacterium]|nr:cell surface protein SprA [Flavobacteriales bacterium]